MTSVARRTRFRPAPTVTAPQSVLRAGIAGVVAAEAVAGALGFVTLLHLARRLGPDAFSDVEYAGAVAAWLLVLVRGGFDVIVYREAGRRPRLVGPLTDLLIGLRLLAALAGTCFAFGIAAAVGPGRGGLVALTSLYLLGAACLADVWPRATGGLGWLAGLTLVRASAYCVGVLLLVAGPADVMRAVACLAMAEAVVSGSAWVVHSRRYGPPRPSWRRRAGRLFARKGVVAGLIRCGRVTLFGLDLLAMGWSVGEGVGSYAASRRLVFAVVGLGMVVPATLGPSVARAWAEGRASATARLDRIAAGLWSVTVPASLGLMLTADRTLPYLFGDLYQGGGVWLVLVAARLPWLLSSCLAQTALISCRSEGWCLRLVAWQVGLGLPAMAVGVWSAGPVGAGVVALGIEAAGAVAGWGLLTRLGLGRRGALPGVAVVTGGGALVAACLATEGMVLPVVWLAGALAYGLGWVVGGRFDRL